MAAALTYVGLTTTFSAPLACSSQFVRPESLVNGGIFAFDPGQKVKDPTALDCSPQEAIDWWAQGAGQATMDIGGSTMICPNLYSQVLSSTQLQKSRALIACCPSSYELIEVMSAPFPGQCRSVLKPGTITFVALGTNGLYTKTSSVVTTSKYIFGVQINGYVTQNTASTTSSSIKTESTTSTTSITPSPTVAASATPSPPTESPGLSTGAKAGIGAGVGALVLLALLGAFFWYRRKHRYKAVELSAAGEASTPAAAGGYHQSEGKDPQELPVQTSGFQEYYQPAKQSAPQELSTRPNELA